MGEAKRRKQLDPTYGEAKPLPKVVNLEVLNGAEFIPDESQEAVEVVNNLFGLMDLPVLYKNGKYLLANDKEVEELKRAKVIPPHCIGRQTAILRFGMLKELSNGET